MKKLLAIVMTLMLVFSYGASMVSADAFVEEFVAAYEAAGMTVDDIKSAFSQMGLELNTDTMQIIDSATGAALTEEDFNALMNGGATQQQSSQPSEEDFNSQMTYDVYKFGAKECVYTQYMTGTDALLDYAMEYYAYYGEEVTEGEYEGQRAIIIRNQTVKNEELSDIGIVYNEKKGFFANEKHYGYAQSSLKDSGLDDGKLVGKIVFKFEDGKEVTKEVKVGQNNSLFHEKTTINWVNVLIVVMSGIVLILIIVTVVVTLNSKKKKNKQASLKDEKYVSEDEVFDELVEEAGIEVFESEDEEIEEETEDDAEIEVIEKEEAEEIEESAEVEETEEEKEDK